MPTSRVEFSHDPPPEVAPVDDVAAPLTATVALTEANVRHLLRRCEYVDRTSRVNELLALGSIAAAVDDILATPATPPTITFTQTAEWQRGNEYTHWWLDQMAHDNPRPFQERIGWFWHSHFCSDLSKVNWAEGMRQQTDLFRGAGLTDVGRLARDMSTQVAMLRYLDNNANRKTSPNQNFARELMELFLLGVGNYTEADVEASASAWTGHTDQWDDTVAPYRWRSDWHDARPKQFLGRTINTGADWTRHGYDTIDTILGNGVVPPGAANAHNRGRATAQVAAEFLSMKLWHNFATDGTVPPGVLTAMRDALVGSGFAVRPWVTAMLTHPDFYADAVKGGLVRTPVEFTVALMVATGRRAAETGIWLLDAMGQQPWYPPNVSGWRPNGYWVNASAAGARARAVEHVCWRSSETYWQTGGTGQYRLAHGTLTNAEVTARRNNQPVLSGRDLVDRILTYTDLRVTAHTSSSLVAAATAATVWDRLFVINVLLTCAEMQLA